MEPRYRHEAGTLVGGCGRFDLYTDKDGDVAVIWGNGNMQWGLLDGQLNDGKCPRRLFTPIRLAITGGKQNTPTEQEWAEIAQFLKIFAPYLIYMDGDDYGT